MTTKRTIGLSLLFIGALSSTQAASVFTEEFNYPDGSIVANSGGIWVPNTGTAGTCLVTNQQLVLSTSRSEDIAHGFSSIFTTNGPVTALYSSYTLKATGLPNVTGNYLSHFTGTNAFGTLSGHRARVWASTTNLATASVAGPAQFMIGIANNNNGGNTSVPSEQWPTPLETNQTYTVVTRYVLATGISTLWINPSSESDPSVTASDPIPSDIGPNGLSTNGLIDISHFSFRQASGEGTLWIDNLKVGTQFSDVAGADTAPSISPIADQNTPRNITTNPIDFTVNDAETDPAALTVYAATSDSALIPTNNIVFGGSGSARTVTLTPASNAQGSATVTVFVTDSVNTSFTSFVLTIGAPSVSPVPNQITHANTSLTAIPFTVSDMESDASSLEVSNTISNPSLISSAVIGGAGANRTISITPVTDQTGSSTITIYVSDGINVVSTSFVVTVSPELGVVLSDNFDYTEFLQDTALYGATDSPWGHASGTSYDLLVLDGAAELNFAKSEDVAALLSNGPFNASSGVVLYAGFTVTLTNPPSTSGSYFAHFKDSLAGTTFRGKIYTTTAGAADGKYRIAVANAANSPSATFPLDLSLDQSYTVIVRYNSGTGETVLWINPSSEASTSVAAVDNTTPATVGAFGLRQNSGIGVIHFDNLIIGTSMSDLSSLLSTVPTPIPLVASSGDGSLTLSWDAGAGFLLQSSTNAAGPYTTISDATNPYIVPMTNSQTFFRLVH